MPHEPKCAKCDQVATHKITKIVKGKVHDILLCDEHARSLSPYLQGKKPDQNKLVELLQHFLKQQEQLVSGFAKPQAGDKAPACSNCGLNYDAYRKTLLLGCSDCYSSFENLLVDDLRKIHGAISQHPDRPLDAKPAAIPVASEEQEKTMAEVIAVEAAAHVKFLPALALSLSALEKALKAAIEKEDFQEAARLRDAIRETKEKMAGGPPPEE